MESSLTSISKLKDTVKGGFNPLNMTKQTVQLKRYATAQWAGSGLEGKGQVSTTSGALPELPYSFKTRFQNPDGQLGTNPEELIAAAHAGCYNMALSFQLTGAGFPPTSLHTRAELIMEKEDGHFAVKEIILNLEGIVPGLDAEKFGQIAVNAKNTCPVSQALQAIKISLIVKSFQS